MKIDIKKAFPVFVGFVIGLLLGAIIGLVSAWTEPSYNGLENLPSYEVIQEVEP